MTRSPMLCLLFCFAITPSSGCKDKQVERPVATSAGSLDTLAWDLAKDRWAEVIENVKKRVPEAEGARTKISGGKDVITVEITDEGYPVEVPNFDRSDLPEKVLEATLKINIKEKIGAENSRETDYVITFIWNQRRWDFFEGYATLAKSTLEGTGKPSEKVGQILNLKTASDDNNLEWLFGPELSNSAKASLGLEANPPSPKKSEEKGN